MARGKKQGMEWGEMCGEMLVEEGTSSRAERTEREQAFLARQTNSSKKVRGRHVQRARCKVRSEA